MKLTDEQRKDIRFLSYASYGRFGFTWFCEIRDELYAKYGGEAEFKKLEDEYFRELTLSSKS